MLTPVHKLARRFWFLPKTSKRVACQTLARPCQKMNGGLTRDCAGLSYNSYKISCGNPEATLRSKIGAEILILAKSFQEGRAPDFGAAAPKNERDVKKAETPPKVKRTRWCGSFFYAWFRVIAYDNVSYRNRFSGKHKAGKFLVKNDNCRFLPKNSTRGRIRNRRYSNTW